MRTVKAVTELMWMLVFLASGCAAPPAPGVPGAPPRTPRTPQPSATALPASSSTPTAAFTATLPAAPCAADGSLTPLEIPSARLGKPLRALLYLPPCFERGAALELPLLILLHGQGFDETQWPRLGAPTAADALIRAGGAAPFAMLFPAEADTLLPPDDSPFLNALLDEALPWLESNYPLCARRACRALGGLSRGAAWAARAAFERPDRFASVGLHSLPPFLGDDLRLPKLAAALPRDQLPRLYLDIGWSDRYRQPAAEFEALLDRAGVPHEWYLFSGDHDETYWSAHVSEYLAWYARGFQPGP